MQTSGISVRHVHVGPGNTKAFVYTHGFASDGERYFYPAVVKHARPDYDAIVVTYPTGYFGMYPRLEKIAHETAAELTHGKTGRAYGKYIFIGNSVGSLVILRALFTSKELTAATTHLLAFASPFAGIREKEAPLWQRLAAPALRCNPQVRDLLEGSEFIQSLEDGLRNIRANPQSWPVRVTAIHGTKDTRVRAWSALDPVRSFARIKELPGRGHHGKNGIFTEEIVSKTILRATAHSVRSERTPPCPTKSRPVYGSTATPKKRPRFTQTLSPIAESMP